MAAHPEAKSTRNCAGYTNPQGETRECATEIPALGNKRRCDECAEATYRDRNRKHAKARKARRKAERAAGQAGEAAS